MIQEVERYHGIVLARMVRDEAAGYHIRRHSTVRSAYVIDERLGLYVKYCTSRLSPWAFTFSRGQRRELVDLGQELTRVCVVLVCGQDGVVALTDSEVVQVLGEAVDDQWIRVDRRRSQMYGVSGSYGRLPVKVADSSFPAKALATPEAP